MMQGKVWFFSFLLSLAAAGVLYGGNDCDPATRTDCDAGASEINGVVERQINSTTGAKFFQQPKPRPAPTPTNQSQPNRATGGGAIPAQTQSTFQDYNHYNIENGHFLQRGSFPGGSANEEYVQAINEWKYEVAKPSYEGCCRCEAHSDMTITTFGNLHCPPVTAERCETLWGAENAAGTASGTNPDGDTFTRVVDDKGGLLFMVHRGESVIVTRTFVSSPQKFECPIEY